MSTGTGIEWTDATWNPTSGCTHASPGCDNCYAKTMTYRLEAMGQEKYRGLTVLNPRGDRHFNGVMRTDETALPIPLSWRKPRRVFVNSMSDLFHKDVPFEFIDKVFAVMALTPQHTYQLLTKRPARMAEYLNRGINEIIANVLVSEKDERAGTKSPMDEIRNRVALLERITTMEFTENHFTNEDMKEPVKLDHWPPAWPLPNVWLGTSVENQEWADKRIPHLLRSPAAVRFLSCEPLLGPIDLRKFIPVDRFYNAVCEHCGHCGSTEFFDENRYHDDADVVCPKCHKSTVADEIGKLSWVIVGGESGSGARPMHPAWARGLCHQCTSAGVAFFFKQWGQYGPGSVMMDTGERVFRQFENKQRWINKGSTWVNGGTCVDLAGKILRIGGDFDTAEYPVVVTHRQGKKASGRQLDGREWNEFPKVTA